MQPLPINKSQNRAATCGQHHRRAAGQLVQHSFFYIAKSRFALLLHGIQAPAAESVREQIREQAATQGLEVQVDLQACTGQDCACLHRLDPDAGP